MRGGEKGVGDAFVLRRGHAEAAPLSLDMRPGAAGELATGGFAALQGSGDVAEAQPEHVVQQERRALRRREPLQGQHQSDGHVVGERVGRRRLIDDGLRQPGADVALPLAARPAPAVQAQPGDHRRQEGARVMDAVAVGVVPAQIGVLHHVLGVRHRPEHAIGEPGQRAAPALEPGRRVIGDRCTVRHDRRPQ
jgi:hypothetical protein